MKKVCEQLASFTPLRTVQVICTLLALFLLAACGGGLPDTGDPATVTGAVATGAAQAAPAQTDAAPATLPPLATPSTPAQEPGQPDPTQPEPAQTETPQGEGASAAPDCSSPAALTPSMTEGPYYKPDSPERTSLLEEGMTGTRIVISGYVLTADCEPIPGAWLDFWQTDAQGEYDNAGYRMRGHQFTDEAGRYQLETVIPGEYPGRTAHIHVKVQAPGGPVLTSQLFFPEVPGNQTDRIFSQELVLPVQDTADGGKTATFNFIVETE